MGGGKGTVAGRPGGDSHKVVLVYRTLLKRGGGGGFRGGPLQLIPNPLGGRRAKTKRRAGEKNKGKSNICVIKKASLGPPAKVQKENNQGRHPLGGAVDKESVEL